MPKRPEDTTAAVNPIILSGGNLAGARLQDLNLRGAQIRDVCFKDARLSDVDLRGVVIEDADIRGLVIEGHDVATLIAAAVSDADDKPSTRKADTSLATMQAIAREATRAAAE